MKNNEIIQSVNSLSLIYKNSNMNLLSCFCDNVKTHFIASGFNRDQVLISLKANYDYDSDYYFSDTIIKLSNIFGTFDEMIKKQYDKIRL